MHAGQIYAPEALHQVRIAAKKLRYALEIADESGAAPCGETLRTIKRVQDALGRLHDLQVLQHHVAAVGAAPRPRRSTPDAGLALLSRLIEDECRSPARPLRRGDHGAARGVRSSARATSPRGWPAVRGRRR